MSSRIIFSWVLICIFQIAQNVSGDNPIITQKYTADPNAFIFNDRVYVVCSHDDNNRTDDFNIIDYTLVSSDDMQNWTDHGEVFSASDVSWASQCFAPGAAVRNGKVYLYVPDGGEDIGVVVADRPEGPYSDPLRKALITKQSPQNCNVEWLFDPGAFVDDDGQAYLVFGGGQDGQDNLRIIKLNEDMISTSGAAVTIHAPNNFEAAFLHKYEGKYYFSYSTDFEHPPTARIDYLMSDEPMGGYDHIGTVLDNPALNGQNINNGNNNHASIVEYKGKWYIFYHDRRLSGQTYYRSVSVDEVSYNGDGTMKKAIVTSEGPAQIKYVDPLDTIQAETMNWQSGIETAKCSEGGIMVTDISDDDYIRLKGVDFGSGVSAFEVRASSNSGGGTIELRLGSRDGKLVGTCEISSTGGWNNWETFECDVTDCADVQNLYLVFKGSGEPYRLNWYRFLGTRGYSLSVNMQGRGSVTRSLEQEQYEDGAQVTLTATPSEGWVFDSWSGDADGDQNPLTVTMSESKSIVARFLTEYGTEDLVQNGSFSSGSDLWTFNNWSGEGTGSVDDGQYSITVNSVGENSHDIQVVQAGITLEQGKTYRLIYDAYASSDRIMDVNVAMPEEPYTTFLSDIVEGEKQVNLSSSKQTFVIDFTMSESTYEDSRIEFNAGTDTPTVFIDNVSLYEIEASSTDPLKTDNLKTKKMIVRQKGNRVFVTVQNANNRSMSIEMYDLKGNVVRSVNNMISKGADKVCSFDVTDMPKGYYVLKSRNGNSIMKSGLMLIGK